MLQKTRSVSNNCAAIRAKPVITYHRAGSRSNAFSARYPGHMLPLREALGKNTQYPNTDPVELPREHLHRPFSHGDHALLPGARHARAPRAVLSPLHACSRPKAAVADNCSRSCSLCSSENRNYPRHYGLQDPGSWIPKTPLSQSAIPCFLRTPPRLFNCSPTPPGIPQTHAKENPSQSTGAFGSAKERLKQLLCAYEALQSPPVPQSSGWLQSSPSLISGLSQSQIFLPPSLQGFSPASSPLYNQSNKVSRITIKKERRALHCQSRVRQCRGRTQPRPAAALRSAVPALFRGRQLRVRRGVLVRPPFGECDPQEPAGRSRC